MYRTIYTVINKIFFNAFLTFLSANNIGTNIYVSIKVTLLFHKLTYGIFYFFYQIHCFLFSLRDNLQKIKSRCNTFVSYIIYIQEILGFTKFHQKRCLVICTLFYTMFFLFGSLISKSFIALILCQ